MSSPRSESRTMSAAPPAKTSARKDAKATSLSAKDSKPKTKKELEAERLALEEAALNKPPATGSGQFEFPNGAIYEGEWQEFPDGSKKRHGFGRFRHGGESYEGQWSEGAIHGKGRYRFASGAVYDGEWVHNVFQGRGSYRWPSGAQYIGEWAQNKMHGLGAFLAASGDRYQGVFHNDRFQNAQGHWIAPMQQEQQQQTLG